MIYSDIKLTKEDIYKLFYDHTLERFKDHPHAELYAESHAESDGRFYTKMFEMCTQEEFVERVFLNNKDIQEKLEQLIKDKYTKQFNNTFTSLLND